MKKIFSLLILTFSTFVFAQTANDATFIVAEGATYSGTLTGESAQSFTVSATPKNGTVTIQSNGSFTYVHNGAESTSDSFTFTVTGSDNSASPAATVSVIVTPVNDKPSVTATATKTINEGETVTLVVSGTDTEGATLVYEVTTAPAQGTFLINKSTGYGTYVHGGGEADSDRIIVKVKEYDDANSFSSQTITITVTDVNDMPIAPDSTIAVLEGGTSQSASFGANDAEIDYAAITNNNNNTDALTFNISSQGSYGTATAAKDGTFTYQHGGTENFNDTFTYSVSDGTLTASGEVTVNVTGVNDAPTATDDTYFIEKTATVTTDGSTVYPKIEVSKETGLLSNDTDLDSDFANLKTITGQISAQYGDVVINEDGSFSYQIKSDVTIGNNTTTDSFTYAVFDGEFNSTEATVTIEFANIYATPDYYSTTEGGTLTVDKETGILVGDFESNGLPLKAVLDTKPAFGTLTLAEDGSFVYVHDGSENRIDTFSYRIKNPNDNQSKSSFVVIKNTNVNDTPTSAGSEIVVAEGGSVTFTPSYKDSDSPETAIKILAISSETVQNGVLSDNNDGTFTYIHNGGETTSDSFAYSVSDEDFTITDIKASISVTAVNDSPIASDQSYKFNEGAEKNALTFAGTDAENSTLTYSLVTQPTNGNVTVSTTGLFIYTHDGVQADNDSFKIVANDGNSNSAPATISITVNLVDDKPIVTPVSFRIDEGASNTINLSNNASDEEGENVSLAITQLPSGGTLVLNGTTIASSDLPKTFSGDLTYVHGGGESKADLFQFQAYTGSSIPTDSNGNLDASSTALSEVGKVKVSLNSVNDTPVLGNLTLAVDQYDEKTFEVPASDAETELADLTFKVTGDPSNGSLLFAGNFFTYFNDSSTDLTGSSETDTFTIEVSDGTATVSKSYSITVNGINELLPQVILTSSSTTMTETTGGSAATQTVTATLVSNDFFSDRRDMDAVSVAKGSTNSQGYMYLGEHKGHYYYLHKENKNWGDAKNAALTRGGYLLSFDGNNSDDGSPADFSLKSQAEMNAVKDLMDDVGEMSRLWLGLSYNIEISGSNITTNKWKWSNGISLVDDSTLWYSGNTWSSDNDGTYLNVSKVSWYPNNLNTRNSVSNIGYMNNDHSDSNHHFWYIVEYDNALTATQNITFTVDSASSSSAVKGTDFNLSATNLTIASGSSEVSFVVTEIQDTVAENNETIVLEASNVSSNARLKDSQKSLTIELLDNENTTFTLTANSTTVEESAGSVTLTATIANTRPTDTDITLDFSGTATIDDDYQTNDDIYLSTIATGLTNAEGAVKATDGNFYVAQNQTIFKVTPDGTKTVVSGDGNWGSHSTEPQGASQAKFRNIGKMVIDKASAYSYGGRDGDDSTAPQDVIYFYDERLIRKLDLGNNIMYYITGSSDCCSNNPVDGSLVEARFQDIRDITLSNDGNKLYLIDRNSIRTIDLANEEVSTLAGQYDWGYQDGSLASAKFEGPEGLAMDSYGDLFVRQYGKIRKIDIDGDSVTTVLENDWHAGDLVIDDNNNIYYAGRDRNQIYLLTGAVSETSGAKPITAQGELSLIVDSDSDPGTVDGLKAIAKIESPAEIFYSAGELVFVQSKNSNGSLRKIDFATKLRIPKGQTTGTFAFDISDDTAYENAETVIVKVSSAPLTTFDSSEVRETVTINSDDAKPKVQVTSAQASIDESGSSNSTILTFQLGDASESGARLDMSPGLKKDYAYLGSIGTHKYYMSYDHESWTRANEIASSAGGYLLVLDDASENTWVNSNIPDDSRWNSFWMGYYDSVNEGDFQWVNGSDSGYTNWNNGESNNGGGEDYVELLNNGRWNVLPNDHHRRFIIEFSGTVSSLPTQVTYTVTGATDEFTYPTVAPITIAAGETTATISVSAKSDNDDEGADAITYTITSAGANGDIGSKNNVTININDDDNPAVSLAAPSDSTFNEKDGTLAISASIGNVKPFATTLGLTINSGGSDTATLGEDYEIAELSSVSTLAGSNGGYSDGTGNTAKFRQPNGLAVDSSGNLYVADRENNVIRMVTPSGVVTTFAGNGDHGGHEREEGSKLEVAISRPEALVFDSSGNLFVGENGRHRISKIDTSGNVTLVIGSGDHGDNDGGKTEAQFRSIDAMAFDSSGNLIVIDGSAEKVKKVTFDASSGQASVTTLAGSGSHEFADGAGVDAAFRHPNGIAIDANDNIYVSDRHNHRIRKVAPDGTVSTFAGAGWGDEDGSLVNARFRQPAGLHITSTGDLYVAEREGPRIRFIDVSEGIVTTLAGEVDSYGHTDGSFESARFKRPLGITASSSSLYISDEDAHKIREIKLLPQIIIPAGQTSGQITLSGIDDIVYEAGESISVAVSSVTNASNSLSDFSAVNATILSEDAAPTVRISASDDILEEKGAGTLNVKVSLSDMYSSSKTDMDISAKPNYYYLGEYKGSKYYGSKNDHQYGHLNFSDAHARATELGGQLAIITSAGEQEAVVDGIFQNDPDYQRDDNRWLNHWIGYEYNNDSNEWEWKNDMVSGFEAWSDNWQRNEHPNRKGTWLHSDGSWHSGRSGDTRRYVIEYSSATSDSDTKVRIAFEDTNSTGVTLSGTGADFTSNLSNGNFTISAGNPSANIVLTAVNDDIDESVESFSVKLASAEEATVDSNSENTTVSVTISDDEKPEVSLSIANNETTISEVGGQASIEASIQKTKLFPVTVNLAFADSGNLIALFGNDYLSKDLNAVSNWVGKGRNGYVDGGSDEAEFSNNVRNMTSDSQGNIYIADTENRAIRKIDIDGNVTTWAGGGNNWNSYNDEDKLNIGINGPTGMVFDSSGNAYITVEWSNKIIRINSQGIANVWANKNQEHGRNNGPVEEATFKSPRDIVFDSNGNMFVLENHSIRKIVFSGASAVVEDFVGNGDWGSEDGVGTAARFSEAWNLVIDPYDNIFFSDIHHNKIRMVTPDAVVTTIAGNGNWGYSDGLGENARFRNPYGIALDSNNDILVNDTENNRIRKIAISRDGNGKVIASNVSTLAGNGNYGTVNGTADVAEFKRLEAMIVVNGVLYTYDRDESMFRQILLNPVMTIPAGSLSANFDITGIDDSVYESDETISVTPSTSQGTLASSDPLSLTITSDERTPKVEISSFDTVVDENGAAIEIYVGLTDADGAASLWENTELPNSSSSSYDFMGEFEGHKYYFSKFRQNYSQALSIAEELGGRLLVIESQEENDFIGSIMIHDGTWIGHYRGDSDSSWKNIYGNSTYTNYANSNDFVDRSGYAFTYGNQWYNHNQNDEYHFIIEYGPVTSSELESKVQLVLTGTAESGVDYQLSSSDATIAAGATNVSINLRGIDDNIEEPIETIKIDLALINDNDGNSVSNVNLGEKISLELQVNDDEVPLVTFSNSTDEISENGGQTTLTANLSNAKLYPTTVNLDLKGDSEVLLDYNVSSILSYKSFVGGLNQTGSSSASLSLDNVRFDSPTHLSHYNSYKYPDGWFLQNMLITDNGANTVNYSYTDGANYGTVFSWFGKSYEGGNPEAQTRGEVRLNHPEEVAQFQGLIGVSDEFKNDGNPNGIYLARPALVFFYQNNVIYKWDTSNGSTTIFKDGGSDNSFGNVGGIEAVERNGQMEVYFTDRDRETLNKFTFNGDGTAYNSGNYDVSNSSNWTLSKVAGEVNNKRYYWDDDNSINNGNNNNAFTEGYPFDGPSLAHPSTLTYDELNDRMFISTGSVNDNWDGKGRIQVADFATNRVYSLNTQKYIEAATGFKPEFGQIGIDSKGAIYVPVQNLNFVIKVDMTYDNNNNPVYGGDYVTQTITNSRISRPSSVLIQNGKAYIANQGSNVIDEVNLSANISIPAGQTEASITLGAFKDPWFENNEIIDIDIENISNGFAGVKNDAGEVESTQTDIAEVTIVESTKLTLVEDVPFQGVERGKISWGDYDKDGDMDLAMMGEASTGVITNVYINNDGDFVNTNQNFTPFIAGDIEFVDVDQDGFLDVAVSGSGEGGVRSSELYKNVLGAFFEKVDDYNVEGLSQTDMEWGDLDNDGDPDLIISGIDNNSQYQTIYYTNLGDFNFLKENLFYDRGVIKGEIDIVDADQDGDNDLFINGTTGDNTNEQLHSNVFQNTYYRENYQEQGSDNKDGLNVDGGFKNGNTIYADIDGDGELDFLAMGENQQGNIDIRTNLAALDNLPKLKNVDFDFADYNNDGQSDLIITGEDINTNSAITKLFTTFPAYFGGQYGIIESDLVVTGLRKSSVDWIDYDKDGDLDLFLTGLDDSGNAKALLYKAENTNNLNTAPEKVTGLTATHNGVGGVTFTWDKPNDNSSKTFRYSIRIGTESGGDDIVYSNSDPTTGNTLINIPSLSTLNASGAILNPGTYYASVQAIDGGNMGGPFSDEVEITLDYDWKLLNLGGIIDRRLIPRESTQLEFMDMDGDGDKDLISSNVGMRPNRNGEGYDIRQRGINIYAFDNEVFVPVLSEFDGESNFEFGDLNNDGQQDVIVAVEESGGTRIFVLLNTRLKDDAREDDPQTSNVNEGLYREFFEQYNPFQGDNYFPNLFNIKFAVGDLNNDGLVEIIAAGQSSKLYDEAITVMSMVSVVDANKETDGLDFNQFIFSDVKDVVDKEKLVDLSFASYDFGDIDQDGDYDFLISGFAKNGYKTILFENKRAVDADGVVIQPVEVYFEEKAQDFVSVKQGTSDFVDFDADGKLDILFSGQSASGDLVKAYKNLGAGANGEGFVDMNVGLPAVREGRFVFGDFDSNGYKDVLYSGVVAGQGKITKLATWVEELQKMIDSPYDLSFYQDANIGVADFDGDYDADIVITGKNKYVDDANDYFNQYISDVFINVRGFAGDFDSGDGNSIGSNERDGSPLKKSIGVKKVYGFNARPNPPTSVDFQRQRLSAVQPDGNDNSGGDKISSNADSSTSDPLFELLITWAGATDNWGNGKRTPAAGLTYSVRIGTTPGGEEILASGSDIDGVKAVADSGNAENNLSWKLNVPLGEYYVAVQSIDASFVGSAFTEEKQYTVTSAFKLGDSNGDDSINILDLTTNLDYILLKNPKVFVDEVADVNNDGKIDVTDISAIVNLILNAKEGTAQGANYNPYDWDYFSNKPVGEATLVYTNNKIYLENEKPVTSLQFSIDSTIDYELSDRLKDLSVVSFVKDGKRNFLIYSYNNQPINDLTNILFDYVDVNEKDKLKIEDLRAGTNDGLVLNLKYLDESFFDSTDDSIQMYPNPAISNVNILTNVSKKVKTLQVNIYNVLGVSVYNTTIETMGRLNDLDVSMLSSGLYTVQVKMITNEDEEIVSVHKLIKK